MPAHFLSRLLWRASTLALSLAHAHALTRSLFFVLIHKKQEKQKREYGLVFALVRSLSHACVILQCACLCARCACVSAFLWGGCGRSSGWMVVGIWFYERLWGMCNVWMRVEHRFDHSGFSITWCWSWSAWHLPRTVWRWRVRKCMHTLRAMKPPCSVTILWEGDCQAHTCTRTCTLTREKAREPNDNNNYVRGTIDWRCIEVIPLCLQSASFPRQAMLGECISICVFAPSWAAPRGQASTTGVRCSQAGNLQAWHVLGIHRVLPGPSAAGLLQPYWSLLPRAPKLASATHSCSPNTAALAETAAAPITFVKTNLKSNLSELVLSRDRSTVNAWATAQRKAVQGKRLNSRLHAGLPPFHWFHARCQLLTPSQFGSGVCNPLRPRWTSTYERKIEDGTQWAVADRLQPRLLLDARLQTQWHSAFLQPPPMGNAVWLWARTSQWGRAQQSLKRSASALHRPGRNHDLCSIEHMQLSAAV